MKTFYKKSSLPIILLKNIDKITNPELEKLVLSLLDPQTESGLWKSKKEAKDGEKKEEIEVDLDLSKIVFLATTDDAKPNLSKELQEKLNPAESFFDKYL
jgi:hypothetical protein